MFPYTVVCRSPTLDAQRGVKICASLVGSEEGEGGGRSGRTLALFKTRKYQHASILSCTVGSAVDGSAVGGSALDGSAVGGSAVGGSAVGWISENEDPTV